MSLRDNKRDSHLTLSRIHSGGSSSFVNQLIDIQDHTIDRRDAEEWVKRLRFLSIAHLNKRQIRPRKRRRLESPPPSVRTIPITGYDADGGEESYVAVSWRWNHDDGSIQKQSVYEYLIQRPGERSRRSDVPSVYLDRAILFAQAHGIKLIWIDKECIFQEHEKEKPIAIQAMDLVYTGSKLSVGIIMTTIETQWQLDCLSLLLSRVIFDRGAGVRPFKKNLDQNSITGILDVLRLILSDERWERTWIFQEDHCASARMQLLIPCTKYLRRNKRFDFGNIPGELQIPSMWLRKATTMFCQACDFLEVEYDEFILARVKQYNIWNKTNHSDIESANGESQFTSEWTGSEERQWWQTSSLDILAEVEARNNDDVVDRLPIFANCCKFPTRLDTEYVKNSDYGLSTCILALCLLNGEILDNNLLHERPSQKSQESQNVLDCTVHQFLSRTFFRFNPPVQKYQLSFIRSCRFIDVRLTPAGILTSGWLWQLDDAVPFAPSEIEDVGKKDIEAEDLIPQRDALGGGEKRFLWSLIGKLNTKRHVAFADYLADYVREEVSSKSSAPRRHFINIMIAALARGVLEGKQLYLAHLIDPNSSSSHPVEPSALFLGSSQYILDPPPKFVFTSWSNGRGESLDKFISIRVVKDQGVVQGEDSEDSEDARSNTGDVLVGIENNDTGQGKGMRAEKSKVNRETDVKNARVTKKEQQIGLRTSGWVNGIWDTGRRKKKAYLFPWGF